MGRTLVCRAGFSPAPRTAKNARGASSPCRNSAATECSVRQTGWLDESTFRKRIQPGLRSINIPTIMVMLSISEPYALRIRSEQCVPHPRHWLKLADLANYKRSCEEMTTFCSHSYFRVVRCRPANRRQGPMKLPTLYNATSEASRISLLRVDDLSAQDRVAHFGKRCRVLRRVRA